MSRSIREQMQADLLTALKGGDVVAVVVLRTTLAALSNAEAIDPGVDGPPVRIGLSGDVERRRLSADDVVSIVAGERDELQAAAALLDEAGRDGASLPRPPIARAPPDQGEQDDAQIAPRRGGVREFSGVVYRLCDGSER